MRRRALAATLSITATLRLLLRTSTSRTSRKLRHHLLLILILPCHRSLIIIYRLTFDVQLEAVFAFDSIRLYQILPIELHHLLFQLRFRKR